MTRRLACDSRYDWMVNAIGPFELPEYIDRVMVCGALVRAVV